LACLFIPNHHLFLVDFSVKYCIILPTYQTEASKIWRLKQADPMKKDTKAKKELLAEIADLRRRLEVFGGLSQKANNNRVGREHAEEALKKAENGQKKAENALKESESRVTNLTSQLLLAEEKERKRIARELHDGLGQSLSAIAFNVRSTLERVGDKVKTGFESLEGIMPIIQQSLEEVRRIGMNLRPALLDDLGLLPTIEWFVRDYQKTYQSIRVEKQTDIEETQVSDPMKAVIYRILQEAMNNIAKHSKANLVSISLMRKNDDRIELVIGDNGIGFDMESIKKGLGLGSMRERAELSGGAFGIESVKGKGTVIRASWPIEQLSL
jgi:signal transduction histidine kinase